MEAASKAVFDEVSKVAIKMGGCAPQWLKDKRTPEFRVVERGEQGPGVILLHGLFGAVSNWDGALPHLAEFARVIALEFPILTGHRSEVRVKALAAYTECFIRTRMLQPITLCGNSLGGHVALRMALASPQLVDCLLLSGASGLYEHSVDALPVRPTREYLREHMGRVFADHKFVTDEAISEVLEILSNRVNHINLIHAARSAKKDNLLESLKLIKVPTLLLWGENDEVTTMKVAEMFHNNIPNSKLVTIKNCGHAPMIEHPDWFAEEIKKFLAENSQYYRNNGRG
jgi:pimeloyl-ACP methyl ester carboxylesterase